MDLKKTFLGIELGSTRIKAVLINEDHIPIASGSFEWENKYENGFWTYSTNDIHTGVKACYADLKRDVKEKFGTVITELGAIGISGMMHGYLPFDKSGNLLTPFRTWRNTTTGKAAEELTNAFSFNVPQRWSISHLYQAILDNEEHIDSIAYITTLAGYIHRLLTDENVLGIGEASGMFPIDSNTLSYDEKMIKSFETLSKSHNFKQNIRDLLPKILVAGEYAGRLTERGASFLDEGGDLRSGILFAPPEGDAGTGMVATNSVALHTGNVSAGTSDFAMIVTDKKLGVHREIDMVTTPAGLPVAMVHCNNCTSDINAWVNVFAEFSRDLGVNIEKGELYTLLFKKALEGDLDAGGLLSYNYISGEGVTDLDEGRPIFAREINANFSLANFMRMHLMSALATLKIGLDILAKEGVEIEKLYGHGGYFKTPEVGQRLLSAASASPVSLMESAGEGGPYGMALLAAFTATKKEGESLEEYLEKRVFKNARSLTLTATDDEIAGFEKFLERYKKGLDIEKCAIKSL